MENQEYLLLNKITRKENLINMLKVVGAAFTFIVSIYASIYFFVYFMIWMDNISDKIVGLL